MLSVIAFSLLTAFASAWHGAGFREWWGKKLFIMAIHGIFAGLICGTLYAPAAIAWWVSFRRGEHATSELDYMSKPDKLKYAKDIIEAYYIKPIGNAALKIVKIIHSGFLGERRQQEFFVTLLVSAPVCGFIALVLNFYKWN